MVTADKTFGLTISNMESSVVSNPVVSEALRMTTQEAHEFAERVLAPLRGTLRDVIQAHGGAEGYMRWVRGKDDKD